MPTTLAQPPDAILLREYAETKNAAPFHELAGRHLDWIYSTALRLTHNSAHAEDVTQSVLLALSQKAPTLQHHPALISWLFRAIRYSATTLLRAERRRKQHEAAAMPTTIAVNPPNTDWLDIQPRLDAAVAKLSPADRHALLLRFYQQRTHSDIAATFNISEEAARKRVERALQRLRKLLRAKSSATLAAGLTTSLIIAAPKHLAAAPLVPAPQILTLAQGIHHMFLLQKIRIVALTITLAVLFPLALVAKQFLSTTSLHQTPSLQASGPKPSIPSPDLSTINSYSAITYEEPPNPADPERLIGQSIFDLSHGSLDTHVFLPNTTLIARDDGQHAYHYRVGDTRIVQKPTDQPPAVRSRLLRMVITYYSTALTDRHPELDIHTPTETLTCYEAADPIPQSNGRIDKPIYYVWLDAKGFARQAKTITLDTLQGTTRITRTEIRYNPTLPPETWLLPQNLKIVDPSTLLAENFPLNIALFTHESLGQIIAVHSLARDPDGNLFITCSTRLTPAAQKTLGPAADHFNLELQPAAPNPNSPDAPNPTLNIASLQSPGIRILTFAIPATTPAATRAAFTLTIDPMQTREDLFSQSAPKSQSILIDLALPTSTTTLTTQVDSLYNQAASLDGLATVALYQRIATRHHKFTETSTTPAQLPKQSLLDNLTTRLQEIPGP